MTTSDVADYLQISEKTVLRMAQRGAMPAYKVLRKWRFSLESIKEWIKEGERQEEEKGRERREKFKAYYKRWQAGREGKLKEDDRAAFKAAYDKIGKGQSFVRIHRIRDLLKWSRERFDSVLKELRAAYTVQLHGGDPSTMTKKEIEDSYMDKHGMLYLTLTWRGEEVEEEKASAPGAKQEPGKKKAGRSRKKK